MSRPSREAAAPGSPGADDRLAFVLDVVSFGLRTPREQDRVQERLEALLRAVVTDVGDDFDQVDRDSGTGDATVLFPPTGRDPAARLPALLSSVAARLAADNAASEDRVRLRVAVGSGRGARGFAGPLVVNVSRLVDSEPLRRAAADHPQADLVVLVLHGVRGQSVPAGYEPVVTDGVALVDVAMKEFVDRAWLWVSTRQGW